MKRDLAEVVTAAIDYKQAQLRVAMPGQVVTYYPATQTADIQPPIASAIDLEDGTLVEPLPLLPNVPVEFPRGGGYVIMWPLNPGDTGVLEFCDFSIDLWRSNGLAGQPNDLRTHALGNAVFRPGLHPDIMPVATPPSGLLVGSETGTLPMQLGGASAVDFVALAGKVLTELQKIQTAFSGHVHAITAQPTVGVVSGTACTGTCTGTTATGPAYTPAAVASAVVKSL